MRHVTMSRAPNHLMAQLAVVRAEIGFALTPVHALWGRAVDVQMLNACRLELYFRRRNVSRDGHDAEAPDAHKFFFSAISHDRRTRSNNTQDAQKLACP